MLRALRSSIRRKFAAVVVATTIVALLFTGAILVLYDLRSHRQSWVDDLRTQAEIVGHATAPALAFQDTITARQNLALLRVRPQIAAAAVYTLDGQRFATYLRPGETPHDFPERPEGHGFRMSGSRMELFQPIADEDERLGTVYLEARYDVMARLFSYLPIVALVLLGSLLVALAMSAALQSAVIQPILAIAGAAQRVRERRDYSLRVSRTTEDETGALVTAFNEMLEEVETGTEALENTNRRLEREMEVRRSAEEALIEANRRKDEFLATLAHELRNPLGPIRNGVHYLRLQGTGDEDTQHTLEIIDRQVAHMVRLIDDLLDISRITRDALELRWAPFALAELVRDVLDSTQHTIDEVGHSLSVSAPSASFTLQADRARLAQAVCNLVNNAVKYTPRRGHIGLEFVVRGRDLEITVSDDGIGIPADKLDDIFQPFSQLDRSLERTTGGLGIGLALARRLIALHGGTLVAESEGADRGSRFRVVVPVVRPESPTTAETKPELAKVTAGDRLRVLVADDNPDAADSLAALLRTTGHHAEAVYDGSTALARASEGRFDVAVLDIGMPGMNGYELAQRVRAESWGRGLRLIALTGWGQDEDRRRALEAGFDDHLTKPVPPDQLLRALAAARRGDPATL